jgi:hypothetical protein
MKQRVPFSLFPFWQMFFFLCSNENINISIEFAFEKEGYDQELIYKHQDYCYLSQRDVYLYNKERITKTVNWVHLCGFDCINRIMELGTSK